MSILPLNEADLNGPPSLGLCDRLQDALSAAQKKIAELTSECNRWDSVTQNMQQKIAELEAERNQLIEQLAIRSETGMAKDMQEIMRINNELNETLTAERQRREGAEAIVRGFNAHTRSLQESWAAASAHCLRYPTASDSEERGG